MIYKKYIIIIISSTAVNMSKDKISPILNNRRHTTVSINDLFENRITFMFVLDILKKCKEINVRRFFFRFTNKIVTV
jgi:hypothetical protein